MLQRVFLAVVLMSAPAYSFAHSMDNGPHGGEVEDANPGPSLHIEATVKGTTLNVYLTDGDGKPIAASGVTGNAVVLAQKKKDAFDLAPVGSEMMTGTGSFAADPDMKALISVTVSGVKQQALFSRLAEQKQ